MGDDRVAREGEVVMDSVESSVSVNDQWRICFRFEDGDAYNVEICDYH